MVGRLAVLAVALVAVATLGPAAHAQSKRSGAAAFSRADVNHDGRMTFREFEAFTANRLMRGSGKAAQKFRQLSPQQQQTRLQRRFERLDEGYKGYLTPGDWAAARDGRRRGPSQL